MRSVSSRRLQTPSGYVRVDKELTDDVLHDHLSGVKVVGVYQLSKDSKVKWCCFDFDSHNGEKERARAEAEKLFAYLQEKEYRKASLLEFSGGGYHVWLFTQPVPAQGARALAEELKRRAGVECEVFPKQEGVGNGLDFGSLVKLPLGKNLKWGNWSVLIRPTDLAEIEPVEVPQEVLLSLDRKEEKKEVPSFCGCVAVARIGMGVEEGCRDEAAFFLARAMCALGLSSEMARAALVAWNRRNKPPLPERTIEAKVRSAYRRGYSVSNWSIRKHPLLKQFCEQCPRRVCEQGEKKKKKKRPLGVPIQIAPIMQL